MSDDEELKRYETSIARNRERVRLEDDNARLRAEVERLALELQTAIVNFRSLLAAKDAALEPFAKCAAEQVREDWNNNDYKIFNTITIGDLRKAREARNLK